MVAPMVSLYPHNPEWEKQYRVDHYRLKGILGEAALGIEHIGSTSIKGLIAKPIIDILVGLHQLDEVEKYKSVLLESGYEYVPKRELKERRFFRKGSSQHAFAVHLHFCVFKQQEWQDKLNFRNYLRAHPAAAEEYASIKKQLAIEYQFDRPAYTKSKEPYIKSVLAMARN